MLFANFAFAQSPDAIRAHMRFLASDSLEGRGTGARGYFVAAEYVAAQFRSYGLTAELQPIRFRTTVRDVASSMVIQRDGAQPGTWTYGNEFVTYGDVLRDDTTASGRVVFVGYGVTAPDQRYDDFASIDAKGKIVAFLSGAPSTFPSEIRAHYSSSLTKMENAVAHGAIGMITIFSPYDAHIPWEAIARRGEQGQMNWLEADGTPHATRREILATAALSHAGAEALLAGGPYSLGDVYTQVSNGTVRSFDLPLRATIHVLSHHGETMSPNVIGVLRGSDPKLRDEYVVYSAHLDHLGITSPVNGDTINNGALDNASGIAAILEIARLLAGSKPRRSILFVATTGEEKGLRGADYFANNPTVPVESIVADINLDEILMLTAVNDVVDLGGGHSDLGEVVERAANSAGVTVSPDPYPEEGDFVRSDQYPFVRRHIPSVYIGAGYHAVDPKVDAKALQLKWIGTIYHTPKDDMSQTLDFNVGAMVAKVALKTGEAIANREERPRWKAGDFFAEERGRPRPQ
jgi:Zn-dependent M28 family amino/carboxypeptidase